MQLDRGVVRLGLEIEVADWVKDRKSVVTKLIDAGYMAGEYEKNWADTHPYHCNCEVGCNIVRRGYVVDPPLISMTYDATLPNAGAEFIVSPIIMGPIPNQDLRKIWDIITSEAVWRDDIVDKKGRMCSPSVHLHVSAAKGKQGGKRRSENHKADLLHALSMYAPEIFLLAEHNVVKRGLEYRLPSRTTMYNVHNGIHHGFVDVRSYTPTKYVHVEWRLFEAAYSDWDYFERAMLFSSAMTRELLQPDTFSELMQVGYTHTFNDKKLQVAVEAKSLDMVYDQASPARFDALTNIVLNGLDDDEYALGLMENYFAEVRARI